MQRLQQITQGLWKLFLFSFPFSIHWVLYEPASYRFGNFNPWVTGFLFLPEILLVAVFLLWGITQIKDGKLKFRWPTVGEWFLKLFVLNAAVVTLLWGDPFSFIFWAIRILEAYMIYTLIKNEIVPHEETVTWLLYGATFQIVLAYLQSRLNHSMGLKLIGEPVVGPDVPNVAKTDLPDGSKEIRPYGTFLHPNILAAYLMTVLFVALPYLKRAALPVWIVLLTIGIYLTDSQAAELATVGGFGILFVLHMLKKAKQKRWFSLGLAAVLIMGNLWLFLNSARVQVQDASITSRLNQNVISLDMALNNFWGVGTGDFTLEMENYSKKKLLPWEFQPVHNAYFLILNETGIQGFLILMVMLVLFLHRYWKEAYEYKIQEKARIIPVLALLMIASFDHLLITSLIGIWLIGFVLAETTRSP